MTELECSLKMVLGMQPGVILTTPCLPAIATPMPSATVQPRARAASPVEKAPPPKPLFAHALRDTSICLGHDGACYLPGTTGETLQILGEFTGK